jgi:[ribosomal protein S5]-alanine N-acetyltransferase
MTLRPERTWVTSRLLARPATLDDAAVVFAEYGCDPQVAKYMTWTAHRSVDDTRAFLRDCERQWQDASGYPWTLWRREDGAFIGVIKARPTATGIELGYALARSAQGRGLMSEAVTALIQWALAQPTVYRVWATCDVDNVASARLLERVGMTREGVLRRWIRHPNVSDEPRDSLCYSIVKAP